MITRRCFVASLAATIALALSGATAGAAGKVTIFAAASLKNALDDVSAAWRAETGRATINSYAASSALAKQIEGGAPADVFISADLDWMKYLADANLIARDTEVQLLGNRLVLVAPVDSKAVVSAAPDFGIEALVGNGKLAMADVKAVPAGKYGKAALEKLGVWAAVESKVAQAENVRAALKLVATGEATAGIVYQTDANADPKVKVLATFPAGLHPPIIYPAAALAGSHSPDAAAFVKYLQSQSALGIFRKYGFEILGPEK